MSTKHSITDEQKKLFASAYILDLMCNHGLKLTLLLSEEEQDIEPILEFMLQREYIKIKDDQFYIPSEKGKSVLKNFLLRYQDYLKNFDIFCAVDLEEGNFAFEKFWEIEDEDEWQQYLNQENWDDVRIAVAEFKKLDAVEIIFMSFLNEGHFGKTPSGWEYDLILWSVWDEILEICNDNITIEELGYEDDDGSKISGEAVIKDIIAQGAKLNKELQDEEDDDDMDEDDDDNGDDGNDDEVVVEEVTVETYNSYLDPYYLSPCWGYSYW